MERCAIRCARKIQLSYYRQISTCDAGALNATRRTGREFYGSDEMEKKMKTIIFANSGILTNVHADEKPVRFHLGNLKIRYDMPVIDHPSYEKRRLM